ncbi:glycosyltransferase [Phenylobacterium sp. LjRoot219]|uniref:glycosyltransferase family protein n=1 Tax=Phenylobacterium sp. LjRoot219 TaxID=3342283 RepID=UPI003ECFE25F
MRFALLKGQSQYGSLRLHIDQLAQALIGLGHEAPIVDMAAEDRQVQLNAALQPLPDCIFGFSGVGADLSGPAGSIYQVLGTVYASIYVDHPVHHLTRILAPIPKHVGLFLDRSHAEFLGASPAAGGFSQLGFLPPGANELPEPPDLSDSAFARRDIPLMFTGTYRGPPQPYWRDWPEGASKLVAEQLVARMTADARLPLLDALRAALKDLGAELTGELLGQLLPQLAAPQAYAEAYHRDALLHALGAAGLPLHIWGSGWEPLAERYGGFVYGGVGSFAETLHTLRRTRVVLNINNGFVAGGHERVFTAMCAGAAVFSDANPYYAEAFEEGSEIVTFAWPQLAAAPQALADLTADVGRAGRIARAGAHRAQAEHRWTDRAQRLVDAVKQAI